MQLLNTNSTSYTKIDKLGEGSFGEVFLAKNIKNDQLKVCKEMRLHGLDENTVMQLFTEVKVLQAIQHPNIIEMIESYKTKSNKLVLILEYASNGDLSDFIKNRKEELIDQSQIEIWILQLCLALKHSHDHKIVHRDLKASNIFLDDQNNLKLGDFGLAKNLISSTQNLKGFAGTPIYLSPESITKGTTSYKSDIWALGVIIYELCCLKNPFFCADYGELVRNICHSDIQRIPQTYSEDLNEFIMLLLNRDDKERPSISQIFDIDFIRKLLINNRDEFKKLVGQTTMSNLEINDKSLRKDFASMKVYRFSEYKDPSKMMLKIENIVKRNEKASKFKDSGNKLLLSEDEEEEEGDIEESGLFNNTSMINGIKNIDIKIDNVDHENDEENDLLSDNNKGENDLLSNNSEEENDLLSYNNEGENDLLSNDNVEGENDLLSNDYVEEGNDLLSNENDEGNDLLSNENDEGNDLLSNENDEENNLLNNDNQMKQNNRLFSTSNQNLLSVSHQHVDVYSMTKINNLFTEEELTTKRDSQVSLEDIKEEEQLNDSNSYDGVLKSFYSNKKKLIDDDNILNLTIRNLANSTLKKINQHESIASEEDIASPLGFDNKDNLRLSSSLQKNNQMKRDTCYPSLQSPNSKGRNFKLNSLQAVRQKNKRDCFSTHNLVIDSSMLDSTQTRTTVQQTLTSPVHNKSSNKKFKIKTNPLKSARPYQKISCDEYNPKHNTKRLKSSITNNTVLKTSLNKASPSHRNKKGFQLKLKGNNGTMSTKLRTMKISLNSLKDYNVNNKLSSKKTNNKTNTVISFRDTNTLPTINNKGNTKGSFTSIKSKETRKPFANISLANLSNKMDEYGFTVEHRKNTKNNNSYNKNPLYHKNKNKINRKSKINIIQNQKEFFVEQYGGKFNIIYSYVKKFLIKNGLDRIEKELGNKNKLLSDLQQFVGSNWQYFKNKKNLISLIRLSIMEIKCDLL